MTPTWAQLAYLLAAVCFIVALKGLSSPSTARRGNLIGAAGAALACMIVRARTPPPCHPHPGGDSGRYRSRRAGRLPGQMTRCRSSSRCSTGSAVAPPPSLP